MGVKQTDESVASPKPILPPSHELIKLFKVEELDYESFKDLNPHPVENTCKWLESNSRYTEWISKRSGILLVTTNPGCGKSVLAKSLVDKLRTQKRTKVCHFFFKNDFEIQRSATAALCAILHQLFRNLSELPQNLKIYIANERNTICSQFGSLWNLLVLASEELLQPGSDSGEEVVCVLDALDECEGSEREKLLDKVNQYFNDPSKPHLLKFFFTSRPTFAVTGKFQPSPNSIHIEDDDKNKELIRREIKLVIRDRVDELAHIWKLTPKDKRGLVQCFQRDDISVTYLWVDLIYKELRESNTDELRTKDWLDLAKSFPTTVDNAYNKILSDAKNPQETKTILHIILAAKRPLTWKEMDNALQIRHRPDDLSLEEDQSIFERRIRASASFFITIHEGEIHFIHQTAREFLLTPDSGLSPPPVAPTPIQLFILLFTPWVWILGKCDYSIHREKLETFYHTSTSPLYACRDLHSSPVFRESEVTPGARKASFRGIRRQEMVRARTSVSSFVKRAPGSLYGIPRSTFHRLYSLVRVVGE